MFTRTPAAVRMLFSGAVLVGSLIVGLADAYARTAPRQPQKVEASYKVGINGFDIGTFRYASSVGPDGYRLDSQTDISALLGAFHWKAETRASGSLSGAEPSPVGYVFDFEGTGKSGSVRIGFEKGSVSNLAVLPAEPQPDDVVPLRPEHVKGALDPLSALLAMTQTAGSNPCGRKVAVFDGKQRFDISLIARRQEVIDNVATTVCRIKYEPISGYRANAETTAMQRNLGIEVAFRAIPDAGVMVPHLVTIPTMVGNVTLEAQRVEISTSGRRELALVN